MPDDTPDRRDDAAATYRLDTQVGYMLRRASQRHLAIFAEQIGDLTPTQFAAIARLSELGPVSQADLGRATAMDGATLKGVVDRLQVRGLVEMAPSPDDRRRVIVDLTDQGRLVFAMKAAVAVSISDATLAPLTVDERAALLSLLKKIA